MDAIKRLKKDLKAAVRDTFETGTVIRWLAAGRYTYAALKAGDGNWWLTGALGFYGRSRLTYEELIEVLNRADVTEVAVSESWVEL